KEGPGAVMQLVDGHHDFPEVLGLWIYGSRLGRPLQRLDQMTYLAYMGRQVELTKLPYREAEPQIKALGQEIDRMPFYLVVTRLLAPVFSRAAEKRDHAVASIGLCRIVLALKAYKYEHGAYPETLDQLEQTLDWQLPEDPFSGQDFVYQRQDEGFKLYSIGPDFEDDGGVPFLKYRYQREPRGYDGDIVWRCSR
ncbi:MAG: hypothetical protein KAW89_08290, partial [Armatimonadetes bacterium]|nr:hypothetical protein [Armatimonadota bacterium]